MFFIQIRFVIADDTEHNFDDGEGPVDDNGPPTNCVYMTKEGYPCKYPFTWKGKEYRSGSCAPGSGLMGPWCYDVRGAGNWGRCTVDSDWKPTCSKFLNGIMMII